MGKHPISYIILATCLAVACSHPQPKQPLPQTTEQLPQVVPTPTMPDPGQAQPDESVPSVLAEVKELVRQQQTGAGNGVLIKSRLEYAHTLADRDPTLLANVAQVALEWDPKFALDVAGDAVKADDGSMPAQLALGAALAASARYAESRGPLERAYQGTEHGLDAGYQLALTLEASGEMSAAHSLLTDLVSRFPDSLEARQALARVSSVAGQWPAPGTPKTIVADWKTDEWWATSQLLIGVRKDEETVQAIGLDGQSRWEFSCGGKANDLVVNESGTLAVLAASGQDCLIDLLTGTLLLEQSPGAYYPTVEGLAMRGDFIAFGEDVKPAVSGGPSGYFGTNWQVYRINRDASGNADFQLLYEAADGSRKAALSSDGRMLFSWGGNHGAGRPRMFQDGHMVSDYPKIPVGEEFALDPHGDRFYFLSYEGALQARSLDGTVLWEAQADKQSFPLFTWASSTGELRVAVPYQGGTAVYSDTGKRLWTTLGMPLLPLGVNANKYLMTREGRDNVLYDGNGKAVARYPLDSYPSRDGQAMVRSVEGWINLYHLP